MAIHPHSRVQTRRIRRLSKDLGNVGFTVFLALESN
jgi:hypothetical protein